MHALHTRWFLPAILGLLTLAAHGGSDATQGTDATNGPTQDGEFTPFIVTNLDPEPIPVRGSDGKLHVAYGLSVINTSPRDATPTRIETLAADSRRVVGTLQGDEVVARSVRVGQYQVPPVPATTLPAGGTMLFVYTLNYEVLQLPGGVAAPFTEPSVSLWTPCNLGQTC